jgi:hypothetical protein
VVLAANVEQKQKNQRQPCEHSDPPLFRGETDCAERRKPESRADVLMKGSDHCWDGYAKQVVEIAVAHQVAEPDGLLRDNRKIDRGFDCQNGEDRLRSLGRRKPEQKKQPMEDQDAQQMRDGHLVERVKKLEEGSERPECLWHRLPVRRVFYSPRQSGRCHDATKNLRRSD